MVVGLLTGSASPEKRWLSLQETGMEKDYQALAIEERDRRRAAADEAELHGIANHLREADQRVQRHAVLCKKHGLPDHATPREISDAWIAHQGKWREWVTNAHPDKRG